MHPFQRTELLLGRPAWERLRTLHILVVGLGGVGSYAAEAVARAGIGRVSLVDFDAVCLTNLNRQLHATRRTIGAAKVGLMGERVKQINPKAEVTLHQTFFSAENAEEILGTRPDYVLDAIDNVTAKLALLEGSVRRGLPVIAAMGAGGRTDPSRIRVTDLSKTTRDPLAKVVRRELRERGIRSGIEAVWTDEPPNGLDQQVQDEFHCICPGGDNDFHSCNHRNVVQGSVPWIPAMFGMMMAGTAINRLLSRPVHSADMAGVELAEVKERAAPVSVATG